MWLHSMFICHQHKFTYIPLTKCGSSSMYKLLSANFIGKRKKRAGRRIPDEAHNYYNFFIVRNPYSRIVSWWWSICKVGGDRYGHKRELRKMGLQPTLGGFVKLWATKPETAIIQAAPIANNAPHVNKVIKLENLDSEFNALPFVINHIDIPRKNKKDRPDWKELIDPQAGKLINEVFERDFIELGYDRITFE